jgi:hypothetical protein
VEEVAGQEVEVIQVLTARNEAEVLLIIADVVTIQDGIIWEEEGLAEVDVRAHLEYSYLKAGEEESNRMTNQDPIQSSQDQNVSELAR